MTKSNSVGKVIHWYDNISVAVVRLTKGLKVGDSIKIKHGDSEFDDSVTSMQLEHEAIKVGKKGQEVAIKLSNPAKDGSEIFLTEWF